MYYVYITNKGKLIFKRIRHDNWLQVNQRNSYDHKLILKESCLIDYVKHGPIYFE